MTTPYPKSSKKTFKYKGTQLGRWLVSEYASGRSTVDIANQLGVAQTGVHAALKRLGVKTRSKTEATIASFKPVSGDIARAYESGVTAHAIAKQHRTQCRIVHAVLAEMGIERRRNTKSRKAEMLPGWMGDRVIYLMREVGTDYCKIGVSRRDRMHMRTAQIECGNPRDIELAYVALGGAAEERALQSKFKHLHVAREWFRDVDGEITRHFDALVNGTTCLDMRKRR